MAPSSPLPGSDGMFVHPVVNSIVPDVKTNRQIETKISLTTSKLGRALCFRCLEKAIEEQPGENDASLAILDKFYDYALARWELRKVQFPFTRESREMLERGHFTEEAEEVKEARRRHRKLTEDIDEVELSCLFCNKPVGSNSTPFFKLYDLDRYHGSYITSGLIGESNYSKSYLRKDYWCLSICFECFIAYFPLTSAWLSRDLTQGDTPLPEPDSQLFLSPEAAKEITQSETTEEAKKILREKLGDRVDIQINNAKNEEPDSSGQ